MDNIPPTAPLDKVLDAIGTLTVYEPGREMRRGITGDGRHTLIVDLRRLGHARYAEYVTDLIERRLRPLLRTFQVIGIAAGRTDQFLPAEPGDDLKGIEDTLQIITPIRISAGERAEQILGSLIKLALAEKDASPQSYRAFMYGSEAFEIICGGTDQPKSLRVFLGECESAIDQAADDPQNYPRGVCTALLRPCSHVFVCTSVEKHLPEDWARKTGGQSGNVAIIQASPAPGQVAAWHNQIWQSAWHAIVATHAETDPRIEKPRPNPWEMYNADDDRAIAEFEAAQERHDEEIRCAVEALREEGIPVGTKWRRHTHYRGRK